MYEVKDKVVLVTGGAAGIGAGVVRAFLEGGAKHVAILDLDVKQGASLASELAAKHGEDKLKFYKCDVRTNELTDAFDSVVGHLGSIDIVVNGAGIMNDSPNVYVKSIEVNVTALITSSLKAYELMRKDRGGKGGTIINIASIVAVMQSAHLPIYNATKSAVLQFSHSLGMEPTYSRTGVRLITLCFGCTDTALLSSSKADVFDPDTKDTLFKALDATPFQKTQSAVNGLVEAYKRGASASTWLVAADQPALDITEHVAEAYRIMSQGLIAANAKTGA